MAVNHERLQSACFLWFWNTYPEHRYLMHANINSHPRFRVRDLTVLKGVGLVKGVFDLEFYFYGVLYIFDIKTGADSLSFWQKEFLHAIESHGGKGFEIRELDEFKRIIKEIIE